VSERVNLRQGDVNLKQGVICTIGKGDREGRLSPALSMPSHIRHRTPAMYASERISPKDQTMLLKCYTNSWPPSEPN
jgi:hypothetical protein